MNLNDFDFEECYKKVKPLYDNIKIRIKGDTGAYEDTEAIINQTILDELLKDLNAKDVGFDIGPAMFKVRRIMKDLYNKEKEAQY